ncbi:hypothetical protein GCM10010428_49540 [Actinosynnema pretiosum subsp. pretiosum]
MSLPRTCTTPGCAELAVYRGRCAGCAVEVERQQRSTVPTKLARTWRERRRRADVVAEHRAALGDWCPGWQRPGHRSTDLVADDVVPVALSGRPSAELRVLCRSCNSRKGTRA